MTSLHYRAYIDLAAAMVIVGSSVVVGKMIADQIPIFITLTIRFAIALPLLIALSHRNQTLYIPSRRVLIQVFFQALTGVFLYNLLMLTGLRFTSAIQSGLLTSIAPAVIAVLGWLLLHESPAPYEWGGVFLSIAGIVIINLIGAEGQVSGNVMSLFGNVLVFGAVICEALFTIFRKTSKQLPALLGATWVTGFGLLLSLPMGLYQMASYDHPLTADQIGALIYYGVFVSALAYFLWFRGVDHAPIGAAGILSGMLPVSVILFSTVLLGEQFTPAHFLGLLLVLSAIGMMAVGSHRATKASQSLA